MKAILLALTLVSSLSAQPDELTGLLRIIRAREPGASPGSVSDKTIDTAKEVFSGISFLHKTSKEVIALLGAPSEKMKDAWVETLDYRFDSGFGGWEYSLSLRGDRVFKIEVVGID